MCTIKIITGRTGEGKTKKMIEAANQTVGTLKGHAIYIDNTNTHRYALSHHIRLIEASTFPLKSQSDFLSFLCGILSANHDIEVVFIDELVKLSHCNMEELIDLFDKLKLLSDRYHVEFVIGASCTEKDLQGHIMPYLIA